MRIELNFANGDSAKQGTAKVSQVLKRIELHWGDDLRVDPLTRRFASVGATYHEVLTYTNGFDGGSGNFDGYFTAVLENTKDHWRFRNAHWSAPVSMAPQQAPSKTTP